MNISEKIIDWHLACGGHSGRPAGHALRILNEVVELCVAAGASGDEILNRVCMELAKSDERQEFKNPVSSEEIRKELVDVSILTDVLAFHTGNISLDYDKLDKLSTLKNRQWEVDKDGVLWRPGTSPKG